MNLGPQIRRARQAKRLKPAELARQMEVVRSTVHNWEHGLSTPRIKTLKKLAAKLDTTVEALLKPARRRASSARQGAS